MRDQGIDLVTGALVSTDPSQGQFDLQGWQNSSGVEDTRMNFISHGAVLSGVMGQAEPGYSGCTDENVHLTGADIIGISQMAPGTWFCARIPYIYGTGDLGMVLEFRLDRVLDSESGIAISITVWK